MKTVFLLFDTLNRHSLGPYGGVSTPNFERLARRSVTFDKHYVGSLPCMTARRDMHAGRMHFLHRSWGPLEPYDDSFVRMLGENGTYTHLSTDHMHYFREGGATYHTCFTTYDFIRGQSGDGWHAIVDPDWAALETRFHPTQFASKRDYEYCQNILNRETYGTEADYPMVRCMDAGLDFLRRNSDAGDWFLQIETFDPHEPFCAPERFMQGRSTGYDGPTLDWPPYGRDEFSAAERDHLRATYEAKLAFCDEQLGRVLDMFDTQGLWEDTMLIVTTDHGYLLGEHQWWAKNRMPCYEEICHIPLFVHHPDEAGRAGTRCDALTQTVDLAPTVLASHGLAPSPDMIGQDLRSAMAGRDRREAVIFGSFGGAVNVTDGNHVLMRYPPDMDAANLWQYTVMPTTVGGAFSVAEMAGAEMAPPFRFTKGMPLMRVPLGEGNPYYYNQGPAVLQDTETVMYDLQLDPQQQAPAWNKDVAARLDRKMLQIMRELDAPQEMIERIGLGTQQLEAAVS